MYLKRKLDYAEIPSLNSTMIRLPYKGDRIVMDVLLPNAERMRCHFHKGWLGIAKLKPLVERYSCQPMRRLDTSNNISVGPSCM